jgi:hypothetical protein
MLSLEALSLVGPCGLTPAGQSFADALQSFAKSARRFSRLATLVTCLTYPRILVTAEQLFAAEVLLSSCTCLPTILASVMRQQICQRHAAAAQHFQTKTTHYQTKSRCLPGLLVRLSVSDEQRPLAGSRRTHDMQMSGWLQGVWRRIAMVIKRNFDQAHPMMHRMCRCSMMNDDMVHFMSRCSTELGVYLHWNQACTRAVAQNQTR